MLRHVLRMCLETSRGTDTAVQVAHMSIVVPTLESVSTRDRSPFIRHPVTLCLAIFLMACVNVFGTSYYVDYSSGADGNSGTSTSSPWQHCPGDPHAAGTASNTTLTAGTTIWFKSGVTYTLTASNAAAYGAGGGNGQAGIGLRWGGSSGAPIVYTSSPSWGSSTNRPQFVDGYSSNDIVAFVGYGGQHDLVFSNLSFGPIGGAASVPTDLGSPVTARNGGGIALYGSCANITVANCYFGQLGYWFNVKPMNYASIGGVGFTAQNATHVLLTNDEFTSAYWGAEFEGNANMSGGVEVAYCNFHNSLVWCIRFSPSTSGLIVDNFSIHNCLIHDYEEFDTGNWTAYNPVPHTDGIIEDVDYAATYGTNINIYNNQFWSTNANGGGTAAIFLDGNNNGASANIYNNTFEHTNKGRSIYVYTCTSGQVVRVYNNTAVEAWQNILDIENFGVGGISVTTNQATIDVRNNIWYGTWNGPDVYLTDANQIPTAKPGPLWAMNYDALMALETDKQFTWLGLAIGGKTGMQGVGWETNGVWTDPMLANLAGTNAWQGVGLPTNTYTQINLALQVGSPCIGAGTNLSSLNLPGLNADKDGNPRPASAPWDIGAYEYNTNSILVTPVPVASFSAAPTSGTVPLTVTFTDTSTGTITSRSWQFGDGNVTNTIATSMVYQYATPGTDTVQLVVSGPGGSSTNVQANLITVGNTNSVPPSPPVASFSATPTSGTAPLTVTFTDTSTGSITNCLWHFGDGTSTNTVGTTMVHQYTAPGTNTVRLNVYGPGGSSSATETKLITVGNTNSVPPPVAAFSAAPTSGTAPFTVTFTDTSTGSITNRLWQFGDGTSANAPGTTMVHQYTSAGTNSVRLAVSSSGGTGVDMQPNLIIVNPSSQSGGGGTNGVPQVGNNSHRRFLIAY